MCVIAAKYFEKTGWVGVKNRDRNYKPTVHVRQSYRGGIERMYIWDEKTKYTEGLNEFGVSILSAAVATKKDEQEGFKNDEQDDVDRPFFSPDGKKIRKALISKNIKEALDKLIEYELPGNTIVFDKDKCFILEGYFDLQEEYVYKYEEVKKNEYVIRTNHGIFLPLAGYQESEDPDEQKSRDSTVSRYEISFKNVKKAKTAEELLGAISDSETDKDPQMNPLRISETHGSKTLVTTGQLMVTPSMLTLHYKPIWSNVKFNFDQLNSGKSKTFMEVISNKKLVSVDESVSKLLRFKDFAI